MFILKRENLELIKKICRASRVKKLYLFGSATNERFDYNKSDLDFLVEFESMTPVKHAETYFLLKDTLAQIFERPVDLVERQAINNPYFLSQVNQEKVILYE